VEPVGQRVDHRDRAHRRQFLDAVLAERAPHDRRRLAGQHPRDVADRLAAADVRGLRVDDQGQAAEFGDADGEGHPGAQARLVEEDGDGLRALEGAAGEPVLLHRPGQVEDFGLLGGGEVVVAEEVLGHGVLRLGGVTPRGPESG
jgi:hypothetical protein